jgi:4-amino-4-deoxy-L-arabinose transferase-like glycosyltransferase
MKESLFGSGKHEIRRDLTLLISLVLVSTLPFINRAIHLDENTYLAIARNVSHHFWFPQDFSGQWFGIPVLNFSGHTHPVGLSYYLALLLKFSHSDAEWPLRLGFIVFPLGYAVSGYFLARRFTQHPFSAAALMMVTPAVLVFSPTLMPDLPMTTFWILAALSFVTGLEERKSWKMILAGFFLICATMISYQAIFMGGLLALYTWSRGERRGKVFLCLASCGVFLALYWYAGYLHYGFFSAERSRSYLAIADIFSLGYFRQKVLGMLSTLGATTVFCFFSLFLFGRSAGWKKWLVLLFLMAGISFLVPADYSAFERTEFFVFAIAGLIVVESVLGFLVRSLRRAASGEASSAGDLFLASWIMGVVSYTVLLSEFTAARYVAALVPPLAIYFVRCAEESFAGEEGLQRRFLIATLGVTWLVAVGIAFADYQYVSSYRDFSGWFSRKYASLKGTVWVGSEAGLRYYMEHQGARTLVNPYAPMLPGVLPGAAWGEAHFGRPAPDDWLVRPARFLRYDLSPDLELSAVVDSKTMTSPFPIRTYGPAAHAGLHGTNVGLLPFAISWAPLDQIDVYRYNAFASGLKEALASAFPRGEVQESFMTIAGDRRAVIALPVSARMPYSVTVPPHSMLTGNLGIDPSSSGLHCELDFSVSINAGVDSPEVSCGEVRLDPRRAAAKGVDQAISFSCEMSGLGGQNVDLTFHAKDATTTNHSCPKIALWNLQWARSPLGE